MFAVLLPWLGLGAILTALGGALLLAVRGFPALRGRPTDPARLAPAVRVLVWGAVAAMLVLEAGLLTDSYHLAYIADNHRTGTPPLYAFASGWAALEGSIVLWGLVLAGYIWLFHRSLLRAGAGGLGAGTLSVLGMIAVFWFGLMATAANPFQVCAAAGPEGTGCALAAWAPWSAADAPLNGRGANPLLQNHFLMIIHPPVLYLGYVGMSVPFAIAMSSLAAARPGAAPDRTWVKITRRWTLGAWAFLTAGILLGGWWSYEVLGWGGYWAWDPVENASFIPWLLATAFLHSAVVQSRRGVLSSWNYVLAIGVFAATILGTFLTRSGVVASVHSFTQSAIGPIILGFLIAVLAGSLALFAARAHRIGDAPRLDSLVSREGAFLLNNLLLSVFAFAVLAGTLFPLAAEAFADAAVGVGRPFFDRWAVPLSYGLLLAMGLGPITPYRTARPQVMWERLRLPLLAALAATAATALLATRNRHVIIVVFLTSLAAAAIVRHLESLIRARRRKTGERAGTALLRLAGADPGYWGGQISHLGVMILAVGIAASANLAVSGQMQLAPGETARVAGYELEYATPFTRSETNRTAVGARIEVTRDGRRVATLAPRLNIYPNSASPIVTPAVHSTFSRDLYVSLTRLDSEGLTADVWVYPLQWMVWLGGLTAAAGTGVSLLAARRRPVAGDRPRRPETADA